MGINDLLQHRRQIIEKEKQEKQKRKQWDKDYNDNRKARFISSSTSAIESYVLNAIQEKKFAGVLRNRIDVPYNIVDISDYYHFCSNIAKKQYYVHLIANQVESRHPDWSLRFSSSVKNGVEYRDGWHVYIKK